MKDELARSMKELKLDGLNKPYYIEYKLELSNNFNVTSIYGKLVNRSNTPIAKLTVGVRVGDYKFDNTNYLDFGLSLFGSGDDEEPFLNRRVPIELDYFTLRRELWLATDAAYKQTSEVYSKKEASLKNKVRKDTTHDFLKIAPSKSIDTSVSYTFNADYLENVANTLSAVFANFPEIQVSNSTIEFTEETAFYYNSEGMEYIKKDIFTGVEASASTQAEDGMTIADYYSAYSKDPANLPSLDSMKSAVEKVARNISKSQKADALDEPYSGPVIFAGQAAAELIAQVFAPNLVAQRKATTEGGYFSDDERFTAFQNKVGGRVLPEFISVFAKPNSKQYQHVPLVGCYAIDDDGIRPQDLTLVDAGYLKTLLSSRVPTRRIRETNGHCRGGSAMISNIIFSANKNQLSESELKKRLLKLIKDRELPYGIIVKKIQNQNILFSSLYSLTLGSIDFSRGAGKMNVNEAYKVFPDGREELVRGAFLSGISAQSFKDIINVGKSQYVLNYLAPSITSSFISGGKAYLPASIVAFDMLFEDAEVKTLEGDFTKPPFIEKPLGSK